MKIKINKAQIKLQIEKALGLLEIVTKNMEPPMSEQIVSIYGRNPFLVLVSCILSLRAKDKVTFEISKKLFSIAMTPQEVLDIPLDKLEKIIYKSGFYKKKAKSLHEISRQLIEKFDSKVPSDIDDLLSLPGVGRKTANLVLAIGFKIPAICVDTHVHKIANRLGWVKTTSPDQTEFELMKLVDKDNWIKINKLLVIWGQNICVPISPFCSKCVLNTICPKIGVNKNR